MRVIELRDGLRFALEPDFELRVVREFRGQDFDRDAAIEPRVARLEHLAHPARPERRDDFVGTEAGAGSDGHFLSAAVQFCTKVKG